MKQLTKAEGLELAFSLLQKIRQLTGGGAQFSLVSATTLMAALKNPGELQYDLLKEVGGLDASVLSRQLDLLDGHGRSKASASLKPLLVRKPSAMSRVNNVVEPTPEGDAFAEELVSFLNTKLTRLDR
jgi:DNA-binding MarR family transcriptional regulator